MDTQDVDVELDVLVEAASRGDAQAQTTLGLAYELGHGVERDVLRAGCLYRSAAEAGAARAQYALGLLYEAGLDIAPRLDLALPWYERAARQGHEPVRKRLQCAESDETVAPDDAKSRDAKGHL